MDKIEQAALEATPEKVPPRTPRGPWVPARWLADARERIFHRRVAQAIVIAIALALFILWLPPVARIALLIGMFEKGSTVVLLFIFGLMAVSLLWARGQRLDAGLFMLINEHGRRPRWLDRAMLAFTQLGNMIAAFLFAVIIYFAGDRALAFELLLGVLSLWLAVEVIKAITDRARPFTLLTEARVIGWRELGRSFPSGHTAQTFFIMSLLSHHLHLLPVGVAALYILAALVGLTRMYVGAHYPRDVIAGALLGTVWGIMSVVLDPYL